MIINKNISDKTFFLLTNYNDPNLFQFHLPFLNLMPYALKNVSPVHNFIKKKGYKQYCGHGHGRKLLQILLGKSTKLSISSFKIWSLFIYLQKVGFNALDKFNEGDRGFIVENVHILYMYMYIYTISFVLAEKSPSFPYRLQ